MDASQFIFYIVSLLTFSYFDGYIVVVSHVDVIVVDVFHVSIDYLYIFLCVTSFQGHFYSLFIIELWEFFIYSGYKS